MAFTLSTILPTEICEHINSYAEEMTHQFKLDFLTWQYKFQDCADELRMLNCLRYNREALEVEIKIPDSARAQNLPDTRSRDWWEEDTMEQYKLRMEDLYMGRKLVADLNRIYEDNYDEWTRDMWDTSMINNPEHFPGMVLEDEYAEELFRHVMEQDSFEWEDDEVVVECPPLNDLFQDGIAEVIGADHAVRAEMQLDREDRRFKICGIF